MQNQPYIPKVTLFGHDVFFIYMQPRSALAVIFPWSLNMVGSAPKASCLHELPKALLALVPKGFLSALVPVPSTGSGTTHCCPQTDFLLASS